MHAGGEPIAREVLGANVARATLIIFFTLATPAGVALTAVTSAT